MDQQGIIQYIVETFDGVDVLSPEDGIAAGDTFFYYDPDRSIDPTQKMPFATIVTKDYGEFDRASQLDRPGVFRLNIGVSRETFRAVIQPSTGVSAGIDYAVLDELLPHPVYAPQSFVCVLNPSTETFRERLQPLLAEAYDLAAARQRRRQSR